MNSSRQGRNGHIKVMPGFNMSKVEEDKENINFEVLDTFLRSKGGVEKEREFGKDLTGYLTNVGDFKEYFQKAKSNIRIEKGVDKLSKANKRNVSSLVGGNGLSGVKEYATNPTQTVTLNNFFKKGKAVPPKISVNPIKFIPNHPNTSKNKENKDINLNTGNFFNLPYTNMKINTFIRQKKNTSFTLEYPNNNNKNSCSKKTSAGANLITLQRNNSQRNLSKGKSNKDYDSDAAYQQKIETCNYHTNSSTTNTNGTSSVQSQMTTIPSQPIKVTNIPSEAYLFTEDFCEDIAGNIKVTHSPSETNYNLNPELREYVDDIFETLKQEEKEHKDEIRYGYMNAQNDINEQMRAILIDWIIEVHLKFLLRAETLFLTVKLIDKFLTQKRIPRAKLQLLGVASMLIACKHEEIFSPHIKDFVYITDKAYTREEVLRMEEEILQTLQFQILSPSALRFYELIAYFFNFNMKQFMFGRYLLEISLIHYNMTKYTPSILASTAAYVTMKYFKFTNYQVIYSSQFNPGNSQTSIKECAKEICFIIDNFDDSSLSAAKRKFAKKEYFEVSGLYF